jgi:DNA polymerase III epsilon subunit-like protein
MTQFVCVDIETTGMDPRVHQILEIAMVLVDTQSLPKSVDELKTRVIRVKHDYIYGEPRALAMNARLISSLANDEGPQYDNEVVLKEDEIIASMTEFIYNNGFDNALHGTAAVVFNIAGKNVAGFDVPFLSMLEGWGESLYARSRVWDPAPLFTYAEDDIIPNLSECLNRAGIHEDVDHTALGDALAIAKLLTVAYHR